MIQKTLFSLAAIILFLSLFSCSTQASKELTGWENRQVHLSYQSGRVSYFFQNNQLVHQYVDNRDRQESYTFSYDNQQVIQLRKTPRGVVEIARYALKEQGIQSLLLEGDPGEERVWWEENREGTFLKDSKSGLAGAVQLLPRLINPSDPFWWLDFEMDHSQDQWGTINAFSRVIQEDLLVHKIFLSAPAVKNKSPMTVTYRFRMSENRPVEVEISNPQNQATESYSLVYQFLQEGRVLIHLDPTPEKRVQSIEILW